MFWMPDMMGYGWWTTVLVPFAVLLVTTIGAYLLITEFLKTRPTRNDKAIKILMERFAKGKITREQFLEMKEELE